MGVGEGSQYISVIVDATDDGYAAVLYVCVCFDGWEMEGGEVEGLFGGGGSDECGEGLACAALSALVDGDH